MKKFGTLLMITLLSSCSLTPDYERPQIDTLSDWKNHTDKSNETITKEWWKEFGSPELNNLIADAIANNKDVEASIYRIQQSRASAEIAGAKLLPSASIGASVGTSNEYVTQNTNANGQGFTTARNSSSAQLSASYELDLFGKNRAARNAALERLDAVQYTHDSLLLITEADVATAYSTLLAYDERIKISETNLQNSQKILDIVQARFDNGINSQLELNQQKTVLSNSTANLVSLKEQRDAVLTQLAVLTGKTPESFKLTQEKFDIISDPEIATIQPSELVSRRPDIASAEKSIIAANMDIGIARAALFPNLSISLNSTLNSLSSPETFANSLIASTTAPIFRGGELQANVKLSEARKKELIANYYGTVLSSLKEVEDAFSSYSSATERAKINAQAEEYAQKSNDIALERYKSGVTDFQTLLDAQTTLLQTQDNLLQSRLDKIISAITLFKVMGGGWSSTGEVTETEVPQVKLPNNVENADKLSKTKFEENKLI